jgi:hypothetical protein
LDIHHGVQFQAVGRHTLVGQQLVRGNGTQHHADERERYGLGQHASQTSKLELGTGLVSVVDGVFHSVFFRCPLMSGLDRRS